MKKWIALYLALTLALSLWLGRDSSSVAMQTAAPRAIPMETASVTTNNIATAAAPKAVMKSSAGSAVMTMSRSSSYDSAAESEVALDAADIADDAADLNEPRKIVKNCWMTLETQDFDTAVSAIVQMAENAGGYISSQNISRGTSYGSSQRARTASMTLKIPAEKLDDVMNSVDGVCHVVRAGENSSDITDTYYDVTAHLTNMQAKESRLLELLAKAEKLDDIIQLETALASTRSEIESLTGRLRRMNQQVAYSTLSIDLSEVIQYTAPKPLTFAERMSQACSDAVSNLQELLERVCISVVSYGPTAALIVALAFVVLGCLVAALKSLFARRKSA